jgi:hypothetical protein
MGDGVDLNTATHLGLCLAQDRLVGANSGIIDPGCGFAVLGADRLSESMYLS